MQTGQWLDPRDGTRWFFDSGSLALDFGWTGAFGGSQTTERMHGPADLHAWLDERHGGRSAVEVWAYGDSAGDRELLADADHPVWARDPMTAVPAVTGVGS